MSDSQLLEWFQSCTSVHFSKQYIIFIQKTLVREPKWPDRFLLSFAQAIQKNPDYQIVFDTIKDLLLKSKKALAVEKLEVDLPVEQVLVDFAQTRRIPPKLIEASITFRFLI
jgi:hypothetical protein